MDQIPLNSGFRYEKVREHITGMIEEGLLKPGDKLPSLRSMSDQMGLSITTIMKAYTDLEFDGFVEAKPQSGFYVIDDIAKSTPVPRISNPDSNPTRVDKFNLIHSFLNAMVKPNLIPLGGALPSHLNLPEKELNRISKRVAIENPDNLLYENVMGSDELRHQIAYHMSSFGPVLSKEELIITNGATEAMYATLKALTNPGDKVIVESPCYFGYLQVLETLGVFAIEVRTHPETGLDLDDLQCALKHSRVRALIVQPNFNNPLGSQMPEESRPEVVRLCRETGIAIIEDDILGDIHYNEKRPSILLEHDRFRDTVVYISSFTKTVAPGMRIGWVIPGKFANEILRQKASLSMSTNSVSQHVLQEYLASGKYSRHLRGIRSNYKNQTATYSCHIAKHFPGGTRISKPRGGFVVWVELPREIDSFSLYHRALKEGITIAPGLLFSAQERYNNCIRINCSNPWNEKIENAIIKLGEMAGNCEINIR